MAACRMCMFKLSQRFPWSAQARVADQPVSMHLLSDVASIPGAYMLSTPTPAVVSICPRSDRWLGPVDRAADEAHLSPQFPQDALLIAGGLAIQMSVDVPGKRLRVRGLAPDVPHRAILT